MRSLWDKLVLFFLCAFMLPLQGLMPVSLAALLIVITLSCLNGYLGERFSLVSYVAFLAASLFFPQCYPFLPLIAYDIWQPRFRVWYPLLAVPFLYYLGGLPVLLTLSMAIYLLLSLILKLRSDALDRSRLDYNSLQDDAKETSLHLERKNKDLMEKQDYEIRLATLNERNRIAREIHDSVGHLLSRSILQLGALMAVYREPPALNENLGTLKGTLSEAMDSIRESVHNLHDDSIDLYSQLETLTRNFTFCPVSLQYACGDMGRELKYCFISVVKEALSNIMRHSNAVSASISMKEFPAFYQMVIQDNGTAAPAPDISGIGLKNMADRVGAFGGTITFDYKNGFRIFLTIPKEEAHEAADR